MRRILSPLVEALFRVLFVYDCVGEEHVPAAGPAVVAANHPSYLDPMLLSLQVRRPIHFMAWDALFRVPLLGALMRSFGAFPVDVRPGHGREAYARARELVLSGQVVGLFPEGRRSQSGWMEPVLREGAARLALETGAPLVPATITGAFRAWPHFRALPRPARIRVRFHPPIDPSPFRSLPEDAALAGLLAELRRRVERSLLPGVKADLRLTALYASTAPPPRVHEWGPLVVVAAILLASGSREVGTWLLLVAYGGYLALDAWRLRQTRARKRLREVMPVPFLLATLPLLGDDAGAPALPARGALLAIVAGALYPYLYDGSRRARRFVQGLVLMLLLEAPLLFLWPDPAGPHLAVPLYAAAFAIRSRSVFWPYTSAALLTYALAAPLALGATPQVGWHALGAIATLLALESMRARARRRSRARDLQAPA